jgi:phosphoribosylanthranilate isomerase
VVRTRIKVCGVCDTKTALYCAKMGVDAIGLVFYEKSPRVVTLKSAQKIKNLLPPFVDTVALFRNASKDKILQIQEELRPSYLQFHGNEGVSFCESFGQSYIKAISMSDVEKAYKEIQSHNQNTPILLDSHSSKRAGGTGETFNWNKIKKNIKHPLMLAGGLNVQNIKKAITKITPYAVDVSSGVEKILGIKDKKLIKDFVQAVYSADKTNT